MALYFPAKTLKKVIKQYIQNDEGKKMIPNVELHS